MNNIHFKPWGLIVLMGDSWPLSLTYNVHGVSVISPLFLSSANISIRGRNGAESGGEEKESFFKDTPLTPDSCSCLSLLFFRAKIFTLENVVWLRLCNPPPKKNVYKKAAKNVRSSSVYYSACVHMCVCAHIQICISFENLHDKSPFSPHSSLSTIQQVAGMKYLAEDKVFHVLLWTQLLPRPFA